MAFFPLRFAMAERGIGDDASRCGAGLFPPNAGLARRCATIPNVGMSDERTLFPHPPWMVGIMLILGVLSLVIGLTVDPFWLVMGSPAILTLAVYIGVRIVIRRRTGE